MIFPAFNFMKYFEFSLMMVTIKHLKKFLLLLLFAINNIRILFLSICTTYVIIINADLFFKLNFFVCGIC